MREWGSGTPTWRCRRVAPDILQVSVPRICGFVNVYLVGGRDGWTLVDTAEASDVSRTALLDFLDGNGMLADGVGQIFLTHGHPDHVGLADELAALTGATIVAHAATLEGQPVIDLEFLRRYGLVVGEGDALEAPRPIPIRTERVRAVGDGDVVEMGSRRILLLWTPGHHRGQLCGFDATSGLLIAGDRILRIPIGVSLYTASGHDPLGEHLDSRRRLGELDVRTVLPGHGRAFANAEAALDEDYRAHLVDLRAVFEAIPGEGADAMTIALRASEIGADANRGTIAATTGARALGHTLAALRHLERTGRVSTDDSALPIRFERLTAGPDGDETHA